MIQEASEGRSLSESHLNEADEDNSKQLVEIAPSLDFELDIMVNEARDAAAQQFKDQ